jgi:arabinogalactan endo-1,4-beta-galactosidase
MRISDAFPSNYLKASDLQGRNVTVTISHVDMETLGQDTRPVLYFKGKEKGLVLNKTNATNIAQMYGDDTEDWSGGEVILYEAMVDFQGKTTPAIRVRVPPRRPAAANRTAPQTEVTSGHAPDDLSDQVPF